MKEKIVSLTLQIDWFFITDFTFYVKKGKCGILVSLIEGSRNLVIGNSFHDLEKEKGRKKDVAERKKKMVMFQQMWLFQRQQCLLKLSDQQLFSKNNDDASISVLFAFVSEARIQNWQKNEFPKIRVLVRFEKKVVPPTRKMNSSEEESTIFIQTGEIRTQAFVFRVL